MPALGEMEGGFGKAVADFRSFLQRVEELTKVGLTKQAAQAVVRLRAATGTQHITRGALVPATDVDQHDALLDTWWDALAETTLTTEQRCQVDLPFRMGGCAGGKLRH
eukprot:4636920-Alexandrium_andersonii.AAC.1